MLLSEAVLLKNEQLAQLWQRDRVTHDAIIMWRVTLRLNFMLKGYVSRQYLWTVRWGSGHSITLQLGFSHIQTL